MNRKMKQDKLAKQISLAIMAGMVTYTPVAFGMPVQDTTKAATTGVDINNITNGIGITSTAENNVIYWKDFSVEAGKTVKFDYDATAPDSVVKNHNYANIVTGDATSFINGAMEGGNNVYLINPNGVIFGKTAQVNVGNLYVSTQGKVDTSKFNDQEANPVLSISGTPACDIVNLGTIKADTVEVVGNNIRFLNAAQIQDKDGNPLTGLIPGTTEEYKVNVTANANGYIHVGHENSATDSGYKVNGGTLTEYQLVHNREQLQNIKNDPSANYMLADHINNGENAKTEDFEPIADFKGNFDGMFYTINKLNIKKTNDSVGLFGTTATPDSGGSVRIENFGLVDSAIVGNNSQDYGYGAIVGSSSADTVYMNNVYAVNTSVTIPGKNGSSTGGLVGLNNSGTLYINSSYYDGGNSAGTAGSGILGYVVGGNVSISNVYSQGTIKAYGIVGGSDGTLSIDKTYTSAAKITDVEVATNSYTNVSSGSVAEYKQKGKYANWDISDVGGVTINETTGKVTKPTWRIYAGQSLPMLTAFFKGTVQADYTYSMGSSVSDYSNINTPTNNLGISSDSQGNVTAVYNRGTVAIDGGVTADTFHGNVTSGDLTSGAIDNYYTSDKISYAVYAAGKKNADCDPNATSTYAMFTSGQLGYDIAGSNFTIKKRVVEAEGSSGSLTVSREYENKATYDSGSTAGTLVSATYDASGKLNSSTGLLKEDEDLIGLSGVKETFFNRKLLAEAAGVSETDKNALDTWYDTNKTAADAYKDGAVGKNKYVRMTFEGGALNDETNYWLDQSSIVTGESSSINGVITPKTLTLTKNSGVTDITKVYDGTTALADTYKTLGNVFTLDNTGVISGDSVALSGTTPTAYSGSDAGDYDLTYSGIKINNENYRLRYGDDIVYCGNTDFAVNKDDGASINVDGKITPREIDVTTAFEAVTKTYDGTASADGLSLVAKAPSGNTGVISADKDKLVFALGTGAKFKKEDGTTDASTVSTARKIAGDVTVSLKPGAGNVLKNYKFSGKTDEQTLDVVNETAFNSAGNITRRNLNITLGTTTGIDKEYDGNNVVADTYKTFGGSYAKYADGSAHLTGNDGVTISVGAVYDSYDSTKDADGSNVRRDSERNVLNKDITYTVSLVGTENDNYTINSTDVSVSKTSDTLSATGKINPVTVTTDLSGVTLEHTYNGKSSATSTEISAQITGSTVPIKRADTSEVVSGLSLDTTNMGAVYYADSERTTKATHAGTEYTVQYSGLALSGTGNVADNYDFSTDNVVTSNGTINAKTISNLSDITQTWNEVVKQYDGTTDVYGTDATTGDKAKEDSTLTKSNILTLYDENDKDDSNQQVYIAFQIAEAAYANKNVDGASGTSSIPVAQTITYKVKLTGDSAKDYDLSSVEQYDPATKELTVAKGNYGTITPIAVSLSAAPTGLDKTYDGKADADGAVTTLNDMINAGTITLVNVLPTETVTLSGAMSASYASKNVDGGDGSSATEAVQNVTFGGITLSSGNYVLNGTVQGTGTIHKRELKVIAADGISKQYDGTTAAGKGNQTTDVMADYVTLKDGDTVIHNGDAIVDGETFDVNKIDANYGKVNQGTFTADANAGADKVKYASVSDTIANANNYTLLDANGNALTDDSVIAGGSITKRAINATDIKFDLEASITKVYDGTDLVAHEGHTAEEYIVGNAPYVEIEDLDGDGNKERLSINDFTVGTAKFGYENTTGFHASKNVADVNKAAYELSFGEHALDNFDVTGTVENLKATTNGSITPRALVLSAAADTTKTYNGTTASTGVVTADNLANGDSLTATQVFDNANVQTNAHVISVADGYTIKDSNNADMSSNYNISTETATGIISPAVIKVQFKDVSKEYDGTTAVTDTNRGLNTATTGTIAEQVAAVHTGDDVSLTEYSGEIFNGASYNSAGVKENEGKTNNVTYTGLKLTGAKAGNYILANVNGTALEGDATNGYTAYGNGTIAKKVLSGDLTITFDAITKTYNNDVDVVPDTGHATVDKYITSAKAGTADLIYSVSSASYKQKDAGTGLDVDFTLQVNKDNYDLSGLSGVTADGKFTATATGKGTINKKTVTASMADGSYNKTYDGTTVLKKADGSAVTAADLRNLVTVEGLYNDGSDVTVSGKYDYKDAGDRTINYLIASNDVLKKNYTLTGADSSGNLAINKSGTISKATMSATDVTTAIRAFDGTTKAYNDTNGGNQEISLTLTGVNGESLVIKNSDITDNTKHFAGNYGTAASTSTENFEPDSHVAYKNNAVAYKSVKYDGISAAAGWIAEYGSEEQKGILKNYNITDTAYFSEAQEKGKIVPLAVTANAVKSRWNAVTKVYDGTNVVKESDTAGLQLYMEVGDKEVPITYTTSSAVYDNNQIDVGENLGVTYTLAGINGQYSGDYSMSDADRQSFIGKVYKSTEATEASQRTPGSITKRGVYVNPTATTPEKIYDGTVTVTNPADYIELSTETGDTGIISGDDVVLAVTGGSYDEINAGDRNVEYTGLSLTGAKAGNYKIINAAGTETTTASGKGKITPREVYVDIKNRDVSKTYDSTTDALTDGIGNTIKPFQYATDAEDTGNKNLVKATVTGGSITYDTVNNDIIYTPTAGTGVVKVHLDSANYTDKNASEAHALGVDYVLSYDSNNIVLVHNTSTDSMTTPAIVNSRMSATLRGENIGTITPRAIQIKDLYATKEYDGTDVVKGLNGDNMIVHDVATNTDFAKGKLVGNDTVNDLGLKVNGGKYSGTDAAASEDATDLIEHTISDVEVNITNGNYTIDNSTPTTGKGVITRKTITANPTNVKTAPGETPTFSGSFSGFVGDDGAQAAQDFEWKSDSYPAMINEKGSYEVYAWYRDKDRTSGNYGKNYTFSTPANTAWTVGYTDPLDPSNPDSPFNPDNPMYPSKPDSPLNPNSGVGQAIAQASKFKPDDKSYNRASHDDNIEHFGQQSAISIQYEDAGVNVGDEEAVVGKRSLIGIESAGNVVNLGDAEMRAGNIGIENNGTNLGSAAEQAAIEAGLPATESYEAVPVVATAEQEDAVVESPFLSRLRQGQSAASDESEGEVSMGISIITAEPEDEDEEEKKNRAALMARSDRETHIGIETIGGGVNMAAAVR
ncbi:MAG: filamentous hemagglutinin N-terminal domain-containing protein [Schwartzia succinivorans]|jgi:filamentous hemagglutinin family protein|uniref:YDG domain-containing protein n=1 Tax=Schwartzia succinivorans TaxID=55507 RepID=UPI0023524603|nr:YDG domain-containing protein [Schwartzia succinivorans]MBE6098102.1 filamentous hemagglutinin N-terminal domain-containing protein [Schwartzia succinivorans]